MMARCRKWRSVGDTWQFVANLICHQRSHAGSLLTTRCFRGMIYLHLYSHHLVTVPTIAVVTYHCWPHGFKPYRTRHYKLQRAGHGACDYTCLKNLKLKVLHFTKYVMLYSNGPVIPVMQPDCGKQLRLGGIWGSVAWRMILLVIVSIWVLLKLLLKSLGRARIFVSTID